MVVTILPGASAPAVPPDVVTLPREVIHRAQFSLAQCALRLQRLASSSSRVDAAIVAEARASLIALQAAIALARVSCQESRP